MGQVFQLCPSLCPKRKKKQFAYDVHQQTFEMDDNLGQNQTNPKAQNNDNILKGLNDEDNNDIGSDTKMIDQNYNQSDRNPSNFQKQRLKRNNNIVNVEAEKKYVEQKINSSSHISQHSQQDIHKKLSKAENEKIANESNNSSSGNNNNQTLIKRQQKMEDENLMQITTGIKQQQPPKQQKPKNPNILASKKPAKKKYNPDDYRFFNQQNSFRVKKVDSIKQQQYNIDKCKNSTYFIFDITANVYIDETQNCFIFIAPCQSTIFVRNCKNLYIIAATKQFRTYQCHNCEFSLYCKSQPVIQSSSGITFSSFEAPLYPQLAKQFSKVKLQVWNNHWSQIHNFTKKQGQRHHFLKRKITQGWYLQKLGEQKQINWKKAFEQAQLEILQETVLVPFIQGQYLKADLDQARSEFYNEFKQRALIIFDKQTSKDNDEIQKVLNYMQNNQKQFIILKGNHNKLPQMGKDPLVALLIAYKNQQLLQPIKDRSKLLVSQEQQVKQKIGKYFVDFGDQRQK